MTRPLLPLFLLLLLTTQLSAATRKRAQVKPAPPKPAMRLVVQLGIGHFEFGFAAFSSDSRLVATGTVGGDVVLWDAATGREVRRLSGNVGAPGAQDIDGWLWGAFSPDTRLFATAAGPNLRLWDIATGRLVWKRSNDANATYDAEGDAPPVLFSPDGKQIVVRGTTDKLTWDTATGRLVARAPFRKGRDGYTMPVPRAAYTSGRLSAVAANGEVLLADKLTRRETRRIRFAEVAGADKSGDGLLALALSPDDRLLLTVNRVGEDGHSIRLWDAQTGAALRELTGIRGRGEQFHFHAAGEMLSVTYDGGTVRAKEMSSGRQTTWDAGGGRDIDRLDVSSDGRYVVTASGRAGAVWDARTGAQLASVKPERTAPADEFHWDFVGFTPEETVTFFKDGAQGETMERIVLSTKDWAPRRMPNGTQTMPYNDESSSAPHSYAMTPDTRTAAWETEPFEGEAEGTKWLTVWSADPKVKNKRFQIDSDEAYNDPSYVALSPDGRKALVATANGGGNLSQTSVKVWDADQKRSLFKLAAPGFRAYSLAWSADGRTLATGAEDGTTVLWDASSGRELRRLAGQRDLVKAVEFSPDSRLLLTDCDDGFTRVFDVESGAELCRFVTFENGEWVVVAPDGRFDTSDLDEIQGVHWLAPEDPLKPLPLEIFMRDYYEPRLLARLLAGEKFAPVRALAEVKRAQPVVNITSVEQSKARPEFARVTVEASRPSDGSGVYDLRLFRDGQLVAYAPSEGGELKTDAATGKSTFTFDDVRLPRQRDAEGRPVEFTAYAFNEDRVKSPTARLSFKPPEPLPAAKGRAYVVSVGVNAYEDEDWDLRFAANDARRLQEVVAARVREGGEYEEVVSVPLISDYASEGGRKQSPRVLKETAATKRNFEAVLDLLAGRKVDEEVLKGIPNASQLRRATPEDLVIVSFSSHGYADERGRFFLFASDTGKSGELRDALGRAISSDELGAWLRDVDAGELILVVDACHSAASVQGEGFKPGPMGSRGLGQLSYDKGMRILTSTQADDVALESGLIEQGLLTYALTRDGLEAARADFRPKDARITVAEWLAYGVERVPALYAEVERKLAEMKAAPAPAALDGDGQARVVVFGEGARNLKVKVSGQSARTQQPALFDFARRRRDALLSKTR
jgi:WD40 repeat protein/uncharacterized caspase-like protein